eukprot:6175317-Pleurochrysis_carterae.AAC.2
MVEAFLRDVCFQHLEAQRFAKRPKRQGEWEATASGWRASALRRLGQRSGPHYICSCDAPRRQRCRDANASSWSNGK